MTVWVHTAIAMVLPPLAALACGGGGPSSPPPQNVVAPAIMVSPAAGPDDLVVAKVGDRAVWGSCVAEQVKRGVLDGKPKTARQALDECIAFELLAQAAEKRGLATDESVIDATRTALVRRMLDVWQAAHGVEAMRPQIDDLFRHASSVDIDRPEKRESWNLVVVVPQKSSPDLDRQARDYADALYAALPATSGVFPADLEAAIASVPNPHNLQIQKGPYQPIPRDHATTAAAYRGALFGLSEIGQVTPVTKSQFGYHLILLTGIEPAKHVEYKDAEPLLFELTRNEAWHGYIEGLVAQHAVEQHPERLAVEGS